MVDSIRISDRLKNSQNFIHPFKEPVAGRLVRVVGLTLEAVGVKAHIGSFAYINEAAFTAINEFTRSSD